jgi:hypothetical protein
VHLRANPGKKLEGSFVDGRSNYKLVPAVDDSKPRQLNVLKARAHVAGLEIAEAREPARRLEALKRRARTALLVAEALRG